MSSSTGTDDHKDPAIAVLVQDGSPCRTIITYSFSTAVHYRDTPQATPVRTYTVTEDPLQTPAPSPPAIHKRSPLPEVLGNSSSTESEGKSQPGSSNSHPWKEVFAIQHLTTTGNCAAPTPYASLPAPTNASTPTIDINAAHKVNIHLAILVGGLTVGIVVITILVAVAGCIIYTRRKRRRSENIGKRLSGVDDTLTYRSTNTAGSSGTTMSERKLRCQTGWQMKQFMNDGLHSPFSPPDIYPSPCDKLEILVRSGTTSDPFHDQAGPWSPSMNQAIDRKPESISDACSTEAPSFLPGDDARYTLPQLHPHGSTTALTEVSCVATIDSNSNSVCVTRLNCPSSQLPTDSSNSTTTSNINSLINHKAFVLSMMTQQNSLQPIYSETVSPPHLPAPHPVLTAKRQSQSAQSVSESIHSDSSHESMYWINRHKS